MSSPSPGVPAKRFRIAFSFAGEKRDYVAKVAGLLAGCFGRSAILYDEYHESEFSNPNFAIDLPKLYRDQSDLIVPVFCADYQRKPWCGLEWRAIYSLIMYGHAKRIMLARFDLVEVDDLLGLAGFTELDGKTPEQAAEGIVKRLALNEGLPEDHYLPLVSPSLAPLSSAIPSNLPRLQPFFGREKELAALRKALAIGSHGWGKLVRGQAGMGKTALAVCAAYDSEPGRFDRIVFLSVKERELDDDGMRELSGFILSGLLEILNELAGMLGRPEIPKSAESERIRLLLEALRGTRVLLIFDNLESLPKGDRDRIVTFVQRLPPGCRAILTSRVRIGSAADAIVLQQLGQKEALGMLEGLAEHHPLLAETSEEDRLALYRQTSGKPLLLRWTAGQLGSGSCRSVAEALEFLRSCPKGNDPLQFIFEDLARDFTAADEMVLGVLSHFTIPTELRHIAMLAGLDHFRTRSVLHELANRSLVVADQEDLRFTLLPLVADFLRNHRPAVLRDVAAGLADKAYALVTENGFPHRERYGILDDVWPAVAPALPLFLAGPNERLQVVCDALVKFLNFTGRWDVRLSLTRQAEERAVEAGDFLTAGHRAYEAGWVHYSRGEAQELLACVSRAEAHWGDLPPASPELALTLQLRGHVHRLMKDYPGAAAAYRRALAHDRSILAESMEVVIDWNDIAEAERLDGDYAAAERDYCEAIRVARAIGHDEGVATCTGNLALLALDRGDWVSAEHLAREALKLAGNLKRQELIGDACARLAKSLARQGRGREGRPHARRAVEIYRQLASPEIDSALATLRECEADSESE